MLYVSEMDVFVCGGVFDLFLFVNLGFQWGWFWLWKCLLIDLYHGVVISICVHL